MARVLVTYATMFGSTAEIAERIGERLTVAGFDVDVLHANEDIDLRKYDAVVAGSPMYGNKWLSDVALLLYANTETLSNIPLAIFSVGMIGTKHEGALGQQHHSFFNTIFNGSHSMPQTVNAGLFHGTFYRSNLALCVRITDWILRPTPVGDYRDWETIEGWADDTARKFIHALGMDQSLDEE